MSDLPMRQEDHPADNMKDATQAYSGQEINSHGRGASLHDAADRGSTRAPLDQAMPVSPSGSMDSY
jgi:hypothetical protein